MPRLGAVILVAAAAASCARDAPPAPSTGTPSPAVTIKGTERLTWDQIAATRAQLATIGYALYVDRQDPSRAARLVFSPSDVPCDATADGSRYECHLAIPHLASGKHTLELSSFYADRNSNESALSNAVVVDVMASAETVGEPPHRALGAPPHADAQAAAEWPRGVVRVVQALDNPSDLVFTPDGRLWIAEQPGRIRVLHDDGLAPEPAITLGDSAGGSGEVLALAIDPQFERTRFVYAIYTSRMRSGAMGFTVARFREVADTLGDRIVLLGDVPASADPHASLRFGPDGKLYAAFDDGGDERLIDDAASYNGKILRLNADGTTPDDAPRKSPIYASGSASPRGLTWHRRSGRLWIAGAASVGGIDWTPPPSSLASANDALLVGSGAGIMRAAIDRRDPTRFASTENVVRDLPIRAVAVSPDGDVYFATADAIGVVSR